MDGIMRRGNVEILKQHLMTSDRKLTLGDKWVFKMNNAMKLITK